MEEEAYQLYTEQEDVGKRVKSSKKKVRWRFAFGEEPHELVLVHSLVSQKKVIKIDGNEVLNTKKMSKNFGHTFAVGKHLVRVEIGSDVGPGKETVYELLCDGRPFRLLPRFDHTPVKTVRKIPQTSASTDRSKDRDKDTKKKVGSSEKEKRKSTKKKQQPTSAFSPSPSRTLRPVAAPSQPAASRRSATKNTAPVVDLMGTPVQVPQQPTFDAFGATPQNTNQQPSSDFDVFSSNVGRQDASQEVLNLAMEFSDVKFEPMVNIQLENSLEAQASDSDTDSDASDEVDAWKKAQELVNQHNILYEKPKNNGGVARPQVSVSLNELANSQPPEEKKSVMLPSTQSAPGNMPMGMGMNMQQSMGMQQNMQSPLGMRQPMGMQQQPMGMQQQPMGMQNMGPMGMQNMQPMGMQQPMGMDAFAQPPPQAGFASFPPQIPQQQQSGFQQNMMGQQQQPNFFQNQQGSSKDQQGNAGWI